MILAKDCVLHKTEKSYKIGFPPAAKARDCYFWLRADDVLDMGRVIEITLHRTWAYKVTRVLYDHFGDVAETRSVIAGAQHIVKHLTVAEDGSTITPEDPKAWAEPEPPVLVATPCEAIPELIDTEEGNNE